MDLAARSLTPAERKLAVNLARALILAVAVLVSLWLRHGYPDDPAITFRVARNFATGNGFVYNPGEKYQASSAPGYALALGLAAMVTGPGSIPVYAFLLSAIGLAAVGLGLFQIGRWRGQTPAGAIAGLLFVISPFVTPAFFNEILPQAGLIVWAFALLDRKPRLAAALLAVATLFRPDSFLAAAIALIAVVIKGRRLPWKEALIYAGILVPFVILSYSYFGFLLPQTMAAKQAQVEGGFALPFALGAWKWFDMAVLKPIFPAWYRDWPVVVTLALAAGLLPSRWRFWLPLLLWATIHCAFYAFMKVGFYYWYAVPIGIAVSILLGTTVVQLWDWIRDRAVFKWTLLLVAAYFIVTNAIDLSGTMLSLTANAPERGWVFGLATVLVAFAGLRYVLLPATKWALKARPDTFRYLHVALLIFWWPYLAWRVVWPEISFTKAIALDRKVDKRSELYTMVGQWFNQNAPTASVGYIEIGIIGWVVPQVKIIDPMGLCTPGMFEFVRKGDIYFGAFKQTNPDYILVHLVMTNRMDTQDYPPGWKDWFHTRYEPVTVLRSSDVHRLRIYRRK